MNIDILSQRSESHLVRLLVSSVDHTAEGGSTKKDGLTASETAGVLRELSREEFLCLIVYSDLMVKNSDLQELQTHLVKWQNHQAWYDNDLQNIEDRVQGMAVNAILELAPNNKNKPSTRRKALNLGISTQAFNKKWQYHQNEVNRQAFQWLVQAAQKMHQNSRFAE